MQKFTTRISGPVAVIGDIHGQVEQLTVVLDRLRQLPDFDQRWIVFIGDFVDRGPDPRGALDLILDLMARHPRTTCVSGNHDLAMAGALDLIQTPGHSNWRERWLDHYNAETTFESYGVEPGQFDDLKSRLPEAHGQFLANLPWCVEHPHFLFVHAGLDPNLPFDMQLRILRQRDFTLSRPQWLCSKTLVDSDVPADCPATVVSGHVYVPQVTFGKKRVLCDTTGGMQGELSCVLLPEKKVISSGDEAVGTAETASGGSWWSFWRK